MSVPGVTLSGLKPRVSGRQVQVTGSCRSGLRVFPVSSIRFQVVRKEKMLGGNVIDYARGMNGGIGRKQPSSPPKRLEQEDSGACSDRCSHNIQESYNNCKGHFGGGTFSRSLTVGHETGRPW